MGSLAFTAYAELPTVHDFSWHPYPWGVAPQQSSLRFEDRQI
jgi:hypothetical protein